MDSMKAGCHMVLCLFYYEEREAMKGQRLKVKGNRMIAALQGEGCERKNTEYRRKKAV